MAYLNIRPTGLYGTYDLISKNSLNSQVRFLMNKIDLDLMKAKSEAKGDLLNPAFYDKEIDKLNGLLKMPLTKEQKLDVQRKIYQYRILKNNLEKRISTEGTTGETIKEKDLLNDFKKQVNKDTELLKQLYGNSPATYSSAMANYLVGGKDKDGNPNNIMSEVEKEITDYETQTGKVAKDLRNYRDEIMDEYKKYRLISEDKNIRSTYNLYVKPNAYGEWDDIAIAQPDNMPKSWNKSLFRKIAGLKVDGMSVYSQIVKVNDKGEYITILPNGQETATLGSDPFDLPNNYTPEDYAKQLTKAKTYYPQQGDLVKAGDKIYLYGGINGEDDKFHHITNPQAMNDLGLWQKLKEQGGYKREFSDEDWLDWKDKIGFNIDSKEQSDRRQELNKRLQELRQSKIPFEPGYTPKQLGQGIIAQPIWWAKNIAGVSKGAIKASEKAGEALSLPYKGLEKTIQHIPTMKETAGKIFKGVSNFGEEVKKAGSEIWSGIKSQF